MLQSAAAHFDPVYVPKRSNITSFQQLFRAVGAKVLTNGAATVQLLQSLLPFAQVLNWNNLADIYPQLMKGNGARVLLTTRDSAFDAATAISGSALVLTADQLANLTALAAGSVEQSAAFFRRDGLSCLQSTSPYAQASALTSGLEASAGVLLALPVTLIFVIARYRNTEVGLSSIAP